MQYSKYNIVLNDHPRMGYTSIYNLFSKKVVCYPTDMLMPSPKESLVPRLTADGFCVANEEEDIKRAEERYLIRATTKKKLSLTLILTGQCNCNCVYCYEHLQNPLPDQFNIEDDIQNFIRDYVEKNDPNSIRITYYGGEPLLKKDIITRISMLLRNLYGSKFHFNIITNGTLLNSEDIKIWETLGLEGVKVTLDGGQKWHDTRRCYNGGKGTYRDIIDNLSKVSASSNIEIKINTVISADSRLDQYIHMLNDIQNAGIKATYSINLMEPSDMAPQERADKLIEYATELKKRHLFQYGKLATPHGEVCQAKQISANVVMGDGSIYTCNDMFVKKVGEIKNNSDIQKPFIPLPDECKICNYLPICNGDCPYNYNCKKEYYDYLLPRILKVYISESNKKLV